MAYDFYMHTFFSKKPNGTIKDILVESSKSTIQVGTARESTGKYPFFTSGESILNWNEPMVDGRYIFLNTGGNADVKFYIGKAAYSTDTWCVSGIDDLTDYLYLLLYSIKTEIDQKFFQGTSLKHLQKQSLKDRTIYIPTSKELISFNNIVVPLLSKISANVRENQELIKFRDWLLPMLMNGQIKLEN